jgi:hypothetical protein
MRVLILGGTVFSGRHVVDEASRRGHEPTIFTRGKHGTGATGVEHVAGDRADVTPMRGRTWDAAIDTSGYEPMQVKASHALDIGHYVFVSSCNAYPDWPEKPVDEDSPIWQNGEGYGPDKAHCERLVLPNGAVVRAGLIVGPHDNVERRTAGAFNGTAPIGQTTMGELLAACGDAELRWISDDQLERAGVEPWTELPLWLPERFAGTWRIGTARAGGRAQLPSGSGNGRGHCSMVGEGRRDELDDWRAEYRPPRMSAEREAVLLRLARSA